VFQPLEYVNVVWNGNGEGDDYGIFAQRYDSNANTRGEYFRVNSATEKYQFDPAIDIRRNEGSFVIDWSGENREEEFSYEYTDDQGNLQTLTYTQTMYDIFAKIFNGNGEVL
jgi:hypothetical protein